MLIYGKHTGTDSFDSPITTFYASVRPAGKPVEVGEDAPNSEYPSEETTNTFRVAGTYVAAASSSGAGDALGLREVRAGPSCPLPVTWVAVVDARTRGSLHIPTGAYGTGPLAVSEKGAVAWAPHASLGQNSLVAMVLHRGAPRRLTGTPAVPGASRTRRDRLALERLDVVLVRRRPTAQCRPSVAPAASAGHQTRDTPACAVLADAQAFHA